MIASQVDTQNDRETGQAAALMAILLFMGFVLFASLAIDGAMTYLARRDLQNVADSAALAACRMIAQNDTTTTPLAAAQNAVTANLGSWAEFVGSNPPGTNLGTGGGLVKGVEIANPQVRVAVQRVVPTVLTQFFGRAPSPMMAQARCDVR
nr:Tad domain-containing protein [Thermoflexales bacterium]